MAKSAGPAKPSERLIERAFRYAARAHKGQRLDGDSAIPYISHPIDVVRRLRYDAGVTDVEVLAAAALHDTVEQAEKSLDEVEKRFGTRVAGIVGELTRQEPTREEIGSMSESEIWRLRANMLLSDIRGMGAEAKLIKLADRASNLAFALATRTGEKRIRYVEQSEKILRLIDRSVSPSLWDGIRRDLDSERNSHPSPASPPRPKETVPQKAKSVKKPTGMNSELHSASRKRKPPLK